MDRSLTGQSSRLSWHTARCSGWGSPRTWSTWGRRKCQSSWQMVRWCGVWYDNNDPLYRRKIPCYDARVRPPVYSWFRWGGGIPVYNTLLFRGVATLPSTQHPCTEYIMEHISYLCILNMWHREHCQDLEQGYNHSPILLWPTESGKIWTVFHRQRDSKSIFSGAVKRQLYLLVELAIYARTVSCQSQHNASYPLAGAS